MNKKILSKALIIVLVLAFVVMAVNLFVFKNTATQTLADICIDLTSDGLVSQVWWINARITTPDGTETTGSEAQNIKKALSILEISKEPVNDDLSLDREKTVSIAFEKMKSDYPTNDFSETVYFNKDFTEVWIDNEGIATYTYKVISPEKARKITEINNETFADSQTVYDICPNLMGDKKFKNLFLRTEIYRGFESSGEYCGMLINDIQDIKISSQPISDMLFDKSEAFNVIEFSYDEANDYYSPKYTYEFCFNKDYSELWLCIDGESGVKYKVYEPQKLADMCRVVNYNIGDGRIYEEILDKLYTYDENLKEVELKIDADLFPEISDESKFKKKSNVYTKYWIDKCEGEVYNYGNTKIKLKSISYGNEESKYMNLSFCIENTIPDYGEVLYGQYIIWDDTKKLYDLVENLEMKCGDKVYKDAIRVTMFRYNEIEIYIDKEVYSELQGEVEILYPLVSLSLRKK